MIVRFSSIKDFFDNDKLVYQMISPYFDTYQVNFTKLAKVEIYDVNDKLIASCETSFQVKLLKDQIIKVILYKGNSKNAIVKVKALNHKAVYPYDPINILDATSFDVKGNNKQDPLEPCFINPTKRDDGNGLYINCNNPEKLTDLDINKALTRQEIENKKVFFTFEHNNYDKQFYYGYQVKNIGDDDLYVTVLNMGFQLDGPGSWLGEKEWIDFYNVNFRYKNNYSSEQQKSFVDYYGFCNTYKTKYFQPITYRIPKGKYIYVIGGTTRDAYKHINVFNTANKVVCGGCSNCAVLFDVVGKAEGAFFVYDNPDNKLNDSHQGYVDIRENGDFGSQYVGYDNCHGVVDTNVTFTFNNLTKSQKLPFKYNTYPCNKPISKKPFDKIECEKTVVTNNYWVSHCNPATSKDCVGTDMTKYYTINKNKEPICIDYEHLDGKGDFANIGNWMMDYMDNYTLVNQGSKDRKIRITMRCTGSILGLVKDINGNLIKNSSAYAICHKSANGPDYSIDQPYVYEIVCKAHSVTQFVVEYNLLANSCGYIPHIVELLD